MPNNNSKPKNNSLYYFKEIKHHQYNIIIKVYLVDSRLTIVIQNIIGPIILIILHFKVGIY